MLGKNTFLNGTTAIAGDLLVPGTPTVVLNGSPNYGGTIEGTGSTNPTGYTITLNSHTSLGHVVRKAAIGNNSINYMGGYFCQYHPFPPSYNGPVRRLLSEPLPVFCRRQECLHHLSLNEVAVELIQLC
jgi:hypothetical protein